MQMAEEETEEHSHQWMRILESSIPRRPMTEQFEGTSR